MVYQQSPLLMVSSSPPTTATTATPPTTKQPRTHRLNDDSSAFFSSPSSSAEIGTPQPLEDLAAAAPPSSSSSSSSPSFALKQRALDTHMDLISSFLTTKERRQLGQAATWLIPYLSYRRASLSLLANKSTGKTRAGLSSLMMRQGRHLTHVAITNPTSFASNGLEYVAPMVIESLSARCQVIHLQSLTLHAHLIPPKALSRVLSCIRSGGLNQVQELSIDGNGAAEAVLAGLAKSLIYCPRLRKLVLVDCGSMGKVLHKALALKEEVFPRLEVLELEDNWRPGRAYDVSIGLDDPLPKHITNGLKELVLRCNRGDRSVENYCMKDSTFPFLTKLVLGPGKGSRFYYTTLFFVCAGRFPSLTHLELCNHYCGYNEIHEFGRVLLSPAGDRLHTLVVHDKDRVDGNSRWEIILAAMELHLPAPFLPNLHHLTIISDSSLRTTLSPQPLTLALQQGAFPSLLTLTLGGFGGEHDVEITTLRGVLEGRQAPGELRVE